MKVAIDFRKAAENQRVGKGEYVLQLTKALLAEDFSAEFILLTHAGQKVDLPPGNWKQKAFFGGAICWHFWVYMWLEFTRPVDVYFASTSVIIPAFLRSVPSVTTLFDFTVWRYPVTHLPRAVLLERLFMAAAIKSSKKLLAISDFTKQEAVSLFKVPAAKITVTLLAAEDVYKPLQLSDEQITSLRTKYNLPKKFILYLGTLEPRKNLEFLIRAYQKIKPQIPDVKLVLAGNKGWYAKQILKSADENVITPGYISAVDKPALYNLADLFVFPSLYEGFGMPPLEAMACGTPTIVSDRASLPEVVQDSAQVVALADPNILAGAMLKVLGSPEVQKELAAHGIERAKQLTWRKTAKQTREALNG